MVSRHRTRLWVQALEDRRTPATFTVNTIADTGLGSLRQAITDSNAAIGADSIVFDPAAFASAKIITLESALPNISDDLTITGTGSKLLTVTRDSAAGSFRIFAVKNFDTILNVSMSKLSITNGYCDATSQTDNGGGIYVGATHSLTLDNVVLSGNTSTAQGGGIAMDVGGRLSITNSTISGNVALGNEYGDPFTGFSGVGGGIYFTQDGSLTLFSSTVDNNIAKSSGAGIFLYGEASGTALIRNTTISSNSVTTATTLFYRSGGAGIAVLTNSFAGGTGSYSLTIQNSTVTGNSAAGGSYGGGIQLLASTSGPSSTNKISARIESTIVAGNTVGSGGVGPDIFGAATPGFTAQKVTVDFSAIGNTSGFTLTPGPGGSGTNLINKSFPLGALAYNPATATVRTQLPPAGSELIDKGDNPGPTSIDARGLTRFYDDGSVTGTLTVDIGAAEVQPAGYPIALANAPTITTAGGLTQTITVVYQDETGITLGSIGNGDIQVTTATGFSKIGTFVSSIGSGTSVTATYTIPSVTGGWAVSADGVYTISMAATQVSDSSSNWEQPGALGTFMVAIPRTLVVTTANDIVSTTDGKLSLREAITSANDLYPSNDTITFDPTVFLGGDIITWSSLGQMFITDSVTIQGGGPSKLTLDGGGASRHFNLDGPGTLNVSISGVSMSGGTTKLELQSERGGSIFNNGENLVMNNVWMTGNQAQKSYGGAIHIQGPGSLTFSNGRLMNNSAPNYAGGAISALSPNHSISISNSLVSGNNTGYYGGAVFSSGGGTVVIDRSTIKNNSTTKLLADDQSGTLIKGGGGGIMVANGKVVNGAVLEDYPTTSGLTVTNSLFDGNTTAASGGAIEFNGKGTSVLLRNSTFVNNQTTGNTTENVGGAIVVGNLHTTPVLIDNCTLVYNKAYGAALVIDDASTSDVKAESCIIALNTCADPTQIPCDFGGSMQANYCFIGTDSGTLETGSANNVGMGAPGSPADPMIDIQQNNGGPTETISLLAGSPCLDAGSNPLSLAFDQRGTSYLRTSGPQTDIGAWEFQYPLPPTVTNVTFGDGTNQRSQVRQIVVTFSQPVDFLGNNPNAAFTVHRTGTNGTIGDVSITATPNALPATSVTITFSGALTESNNSLVDGLYDLIIGAAQVSSTGGALDGNNDGIPGGDYVSTGTTANKHFRFYGDQNGDAAVDQTDYLVFRNAVSGGPSQIFDFNNDGDVDQIDYLAFRNRISGGP
ncbi:MAG: choice-of-anchor Q domain-containing protein [Gemmataceae bacterium]